MIVKTVNGEVVRFVDCVSAAVIPDIQEEESGKQLFSIVYCFENGRDATYPLSAGDKIWYLNENGRTIDRDFRMCCQELKTG